MTDPETPTHKEHEHSHEITQEGFLVHPSVFHTHKHANERNAHHYWMEEPDAPEF